jgi:RNA polymerase sigma-70 factor (ECF subfamily)
VYRLSFAIVANEADARDATQEAFVAAWRQLPKLRDAGRFEAWLSRLVVNSARMARRARRRRGVREIPAHEILSGFGAHDPSIDDGVRLAAALGRLAPDQRAILALHHLEDRSIAEIASILDIPPGARWACQSDTRGRRGRRPWATGRKRRPCSLMARCRRGTK